MRKESKNLSPFTDEEATLFLAMQCKQRMRAESVLPPTPAQLKAYQSLPAIGGL